jgi:hypothetical protein
LNPLPGWAAQLIRARTQTAAAHWTSQRSTLNFNSSKMKAFDEQRLRRPQPPGRANHPDHSITCPTPQANLLEAIHVNLRGKTHPNNEPIWTPFVTNIDYNAKGQRVLIEYGMLDSTGNSKARTQYDYDRDTFRLTQLLTTRSLNTQLQSLNYAYDPVGNITAIRDEAQPVIFFDQQVGRTPLRRRAYRLIEAEGRARRAGRPAPLSTSPVIAPNRTMSGPCASTPGADYDPVGNICDARLKDWTRHYRAR